MAALSTVEKLVEGLRSLGHPLEARQVWLTEGVGLTLGTYPRATHVYDFSKDRLEYIQSGGELSGPSEFRFEKERINRIGAAKRVGEKYELETKDKIYQFGSATQALTESVWIVESLSPGTLIKLAAMKGRTKRPIATSHEKLYDFPHPKSHSTMLPNGFYVATNNKAQEAINVVRLAIDTAGLSGAVHIRRAKV